MKKLNSDILNFILKSTAVTWLKVCQELIEEHIDEFDKILLLGDVEKNKAEAINTIQSNGELFLFITEKNLKTPIFLEDIPEQTEQGNYELSLLSCEMIKILYQENKPIITQGKITQAIELLRRNTTFTHLFEVQLTKDLNKTRNSSTSSNSPQEIRERILSSPFFPDLVKYGIIQDEELDSAIKSLSEFMEK